MPSTHTSLHHHFVFGTKNRAPSIKKEFREELHRYLGGTVKGLGGKPLNIGGTDDHVHLLVGLKPTHTIADVVRELKKASSKWVHEHVGRREFAWQEGYGAFTVSRSNLDQVSAYVANQEVHHRKATFDEEYRALLVRHGVEFDERYLR